MNNKIPFVFLGLYQDKQINHGFFLGLQKIKKKDMGIPQGLHRDSIKSAKNPFYFL